MKKILLIYDEIGWAFFNHCSEIKKRLSGEYTIDMVDHRKNIVELSKNYDLIYILDPMPLLHGYPLANKTILLSASGSLISIQKRQSTC